MEKKGFARVLAVARKYAPEIETGLSIVKDNGVRAAMAGVILLHILDDARPSLPVLSTAGRRKRVVGDSETGVGEAPVKGTQERVMELKTGGFFAEPRTPEAVREKLRVEGYHHSRADVVMSLLRLARKKLLRRIPGGGGRKRARFSYVQP